MKKLLILISLILFSVSLQAQFIMSRNNYVPPASASAPPTYVAQYQAVLDAMTTDPTGDTLTWQNELVDSLVTYGGTTKYLDRMSWLYIPATTNNGNGEALINWANPGTWTAQVVSTPVWTRLKGYSTDALTKYLDTGWNPSSDSSKYKRDDASIGSYVTVAGALEQAGVVGNAQNGIVPLYSTQWFAGNINAINGPGVAGQSSRPTGFFIITRTSRTLSTIYSNGISRATSDQASSTLNPNDWRILEDWFAYTTSTVGIAFAGLSFTTAEIVQLNRFFERYMDHIGSGTQP